MDLRVELVGQRLIPGRRRMALMSLSLQPVSLILQPPPNRLVYRGTKLGLTSMGLQLSSSRLQPLHPNPRLNPVLLRLHPGSSRINPVPTS